MTASVTAPNPPVAPHALTLRPEERRILAKRRLAPADRAAVAHLLDPFEVALRTWTLQGWAPSAVADNAVQCAVHFCARLILQRGNGCAGKEMLAARARNANAGARAGGCTARRTRLQGETVPAARATQWSVGARPAPNRRIQRRTPVPAL